MTIRILVLELSKRQIHEVNQLRLMTRSDFDGLVCAAILKKIKIVDEICFVHPKDVQDGMVEINGSEVVANLPYIPGCALWFDHHSSEFERTKLNGSYNGESRLAPSAARVVYDYYSTYPENNVVLNEFSDLIKVADIVDSAKFSQEDIINPLGWTMLAFITDPRSNFGKNKSFRISNLELLKSLPDLLCEKNVDEILKMPDFLERVVAYEKSIDEYKKKLLECTQIKGNAILTDFRSLENVHIGNRFLEYVLYPKQNISVRLSDGKNKQFVMIAIGHSIFNKTSTVDVGRLALKYGGGGHKRAGTCQVSHENADKYILEIIEAVNF